VDSEPAQAPRTNAPLSAWLPDDAARSLETTVSSDSPEPEHVLRTPRPRLVASDLDGTLVDTVPDIARCIDSVLRDTGGATQPPMT